MKARKNSGMIGAVALATVLGMSGATGAGAVSSGHSPTLHTSNAHVAKVVTCYKGKLVKKFTVKTNKCPAGWSLKKPAVANKVAFKGTYSGTMSLLWSASDVKVTALSGTGTATLGLAAVSGTGSSQPTSTCDPINGTGTLSGAGSTLKLMLNTTSKACATDSAAPTTVSVTGSAKVLSGTGKFAGATGTLSVTGTFSIKSTTAGSNESDSWNATLTGTLTTK